MMLYVALFLLLVGLFLLSLIKRRVGGKAGRSEPSGPARAEEAPEPYNRGEGE